MIALCAALALAGPADLEVERATLAQDEGRSAEARKHAIQALALDPGDYRAHRVYLQSTTDLGLARFADAEYRNLGPPVAQVAWAWSRVEDGAGPAAALNDPGFGAKASDVAAVARASLALTTGDAQAAVDLLAGLDTADALGRRLQALLDQGAWKDAAALSKEILADHPDRPEALVSLYGGDAPTGRIKRARARARRTVTAAVAGSGDPVFLYRARRLLLEAKEGDRAAALGDQLRALGEDVPLDRLPWGPAMRKSVRAVLVMAPDPTLPAATPRELEEVGPVVARRLAERGRVQAALAVWTQLRAVTDTAAIARGHAAALLANGDVEAARVAALAAVVNAAAPSSNDAARLRRDRQAQELAEALAMLAEVETVAGNSDVASAYRALAAALDPGGEIPAPAGGQRPDLTDRSGADPWERALEASGYLLGEFDSAAVHELTVLAATQPGGDVVRRKRLAVACDVRSAAEQSSNPAIALAFALIAEHIEPTRGRLVAEAKLLEARGDEVAAFRVWAVAAHLGSREAMRAVQRTYDGPGDWREVAREVRSYWQSVAPAPLVVAPTVEPPTAKGEPADRPSAMPAAPSHGRPGAKPVRPSTAPSESGAGRPAGRPARPAGDAPGPRRDRPKPAGARVGATSPTFSVQVEGGPLISDGSGRVVILNFWASWCAPCMEELPALARMARRLEDDGVDVVVLAVSVDERRAGFAQVQAKKRRQLEGLSVGWSPMTGRAFKVTSLPVTWLIDADGVLADHIKGYSPEGVERLERRARDLVGGS